MQDHIHQPSTSHASAPGTLRQQLLTVATYLAMDQDERLRDPARCWESARWLAIPHARRVVGDGIHHGG